MTESRISPHVLWLDNLLNNIINRTHRGVSIGICGPIAVGKTTLVQDLVYNLKALGSSAVAIQEPFAENPYLPLFYESTASRTRWALATQIRFLTDRLASHREMLEHVSRSDICIQDRTLVEDPIFVEMLHDRGDMSDVDYETYTGFRRVIIDKEPLHDIYIYLRECPEECLRRCRQRARDMESTVDLEYMTSLCEQYEVWSHDPRFANRVLVVNWADTPRPPDVTPEQHKVNRLGRLANAISDKLAALHGNHVPSSSDEDSESDDQSSAESE